MPNMLNIIYDATLVTNIFYKDSGRSGIFFVCQNILNELVKRKDVKVLLYFAPEAYADGFRLQQQFYPDVDCVQDLSKYRIVRFMHRKFRYWYSALYHHTLLRKFISLGMSFCYAFFLMFLKNNAFKVHNCNAFFSPFYEIPKFFRRQQRIKSYILIHDFIPLIYPQYYPKAPPFITNAMSCAKDGTFFFFNSQCTMEDAKRLFPSFVKTNAMVTYLAANENFKQIKNPIAFKRIKRKYNIPDGKRYVFSLCTLEPRKNLIRAVKTFIQFLEKNDIKDLVWVMGGSAWTSFMQQLKKDGVAWDENAVIRAGYVDDEDLPVLYSNAEWFVYTSQYEGFGLPPLEAMQCGCPVITSNNSSLPEVVGDAGIVIDWDSDEQHIEAYERYYFNKNLQEEYRQKGLERAATFSWRNTVNRMLDVMMTESPS